MAAVVNSRDVLLQAYSPRVNDVQIQDNIIVDSGSITGDGFTIVGKKSLRVYASSQIIRHYTATGDDLSNITLTVIPSNLTGDVVLHIMSGTVVGSPSFGEGYNVTIPTSNITSDVVVFAVTITESSVTYRDEITVVRSREGSSDVVSYLTQEYCVIPADSYNNPLSYADAAGAFKLWQGTYDVTTSFAFSVHSNPDDLTVTLNSATGVWSVSSGMLPVATAQVVLRAAQGLDTYDQTVTLVKIGGSYNGVRSRRTFVIPLNNISVFSDSLAALVASTDGGPILGDLVTQYDTDGSFTKSKFWTGSSWVELNAFVDGNLLVKGTVVADKLSVDELSAITANVGELIIGVDGSITSHDYAPGVSGFKIEGGTNSSITINKGNIGGLIISDTGIETQGYATGDGFKIDAAEGSIKNLDESRVLNLGATGVERVLDIDDKIVILADGTMNINALNVIGSEQIQPESVTVSGANSNSSQVVVDAGVSSIVSTTISSDGSPVYIHAKCRATLFNESGGGSIVIKLAVYHGSTVLLERSYTIPELQEIVVDFNEPVYVTSTSTGSNTFSIKTEVDPPGYGRTTVESSDATIFTLALKR